ncbi:MAG TPA: hypothetical protein PLK37_10165 [Terricaulis sp.]|nr:hypothetical protein [Terricaulis sp.]
MGKSLIVAGALALAAVLTGAAGPAIAPHAAALARALDAHTTALQRERYALAAGPLRGEVRAAAPASVSVRLWANQDYVLAAACAEACGELRLRVRDPAGAVIAEVSGASPRIRVRPGVTGRHAIESAAPHCRAAPCHYALNVYAR